MSIETMFAIGRPARSSAHKTCTRCKGTGWWQLGRICFKCGGVGNAEKVTLATQIRDKCIHITQVQDIIAAARARIAAAPTPLLMARRHIEHATREATEAEALLAKLEGELVAMGGAL